MEGDATLGLELLTSFLKSIKGHINTLYRILGEQNKHLLAHEKVIDEFQQRIEHLQRTIMAMEQFSQKRSGKVTKIVLPSTAYHETVNFEFNKNGFFYFT